MSHLEAATVVTRSSRVDAGSRVSRALIVLLVVLTTQLAVPISGAVDPLWDPEDHFGADVYSGCGAYHNTSNEFTSCGSMQNNIWFAGRPASFGNQWPGIDTAVQSSLSGDYNPTELVAYWTTTDNLPDVWFWDWTWTNQPYGRAGWTDCPESNTQEGYHALDQLESRFCRGQIIRFNWTGVMQYADVGLIDIDGSGVGLPLWKFSAFMACHEMGHTLGLKELHGGPTYQSCMNYQWSGVPGTYGELLGWFSDLGGPDKGEIDEHY